VWGSCAACELSNQFAVTACLSSWKKYGPITPNLPTHHRLSHVQREEGIDEAAVNLRLINNGSSVCFHTQMSVNVPCPHADGCIICHNFIHVLCKSSTGLPIIVDTALAQASSCMDENSNLGSIFVSHSDLKCLMQWRMLRCRAMGTSHYCWPNSLNIPGCLDRSCTSRWFL
jgi:hypothetical protein